MSKKTMIGMDLLEWNALAGLSDPYSLELAKISAEVGVPSLEEGNPQRDFRDPESSASQKDPSKHRLALIKKSHRKLRGSRNQDVLANYERNAKLKKMMNAKSESGEQIIFPYDVYLEAFLEDNGSSLYEFNMLMDYAIEHGDDELAGELLAVEDQLDEILQGLGAAAKAVGGAAVKGTKLAGKGAMAVGKGAMKGAQAVAKGAGNLAGQAKKGFQAGMAASGAAQQAAPEAPAAGGAAPAPTPAAPAPAAPTPGAGAADKGAAPTAGATAPAAGAKAPAPQAQTAGGQGAGGASAPSQPGQDTGGQAAAKPKKGKEPGLLGTLARGVGKVAKGVASLPGGMMATGARFAKGVKAGYKGEEAEMFEAFLAESGISVDEYLMVIEHAFELGDDEMIESAHHLDEIFDSWKKKKEAERARKEAETKAAWARARAGKEVAGSQERSKKGLDLTPAQKAEMEKRLQTGGKKYTQNPAPRTIPRRQINYGRPGEAKKANEAMNHILSMAGYTDEYIEGRTKAQQYHGMKLMNRDADQRSQYKHHYKRDAEDLAKKVTKSDKSQSRRWDGMKKLRSVGVASDPNIGDNIADERASSKKQGKDKLAARAKLSPRERRGEMRKAARGHKSDAY